jgi:hypothetical protein
MGIAGLNIYISTNMLQIIISRLKEPSTYAGISSLLALFGVQVSDSKLQSISQALAALAGVAAIFLSEKTKANASGTQPPQNP